MTEKISYTICVNSKDQLAGGTNNNCSFYIPWSTILPMNDNCKVAFSFQSVGDYYFDTTTIINSSASLFCDFSSRSYQYNTSKNGPSSSMGLITRDPYNTQTTFNTFSSSPSQNVPKTIVRPNNDNLHIKIINNATNEPLVATTSNGNPTTDMSSWVLYLEFIPIN